jgi:SAM-dependent methyltransferase
MNEQSTVKSLCHGRVMTTPDDETRVWDHKANDAAYQVWSDHDPAKWEKAADKCVDYFREQLNPVWGEHKLFVEIGCGVGRLTHRLARKDSPPHFIGLDVSPRMIDLATEHELPNETFIVNNGRTLKDIHKADAIYSMLTFQHIPRHAFFSYLEEIGRALKPGGLFCFQYVEGDSENRLAHETSRYQVIDKLCDHGLNATVANHGFMEDRWTWITGVKRG